jgi:hypothetical protein
MNLNYYHVDVLTQEEIAKIKNFAITKLFPLVKIKLLDKSKPYNGFTYVNLSEHFKSDSNISWMLAKYPELEPSLAILTLKSGQALECHLDRRNLAINFPVTGCTELSPTIFYGELNKYEHYFKEMYQVYFLKEGIVPIEEERASLIDKPMIIDVKRWHSIANNGTEDRTIISWNFKNDISFEKATGIFSVRR